MKMKNFKILISLVTIVLAILVIGNVITLAAEPTKITSSGNSNTTTITPIGSATNTNNNSNTANTNTNTNTLENVVSGTVSIANTNSADTNTNTNGARNTSSYVSTNTSKLPYAGTASSSLIILAIAFAASAIYAYKKVTDYNL